MVSEILFLTFFDENIWFIKKKLIKNNYTTAEVLLITKKVELINKKIFIAIAMDENCETFIVYVTFIMKIILISS